MSILTVSEIEDKIARTKTDLNAARSEVGSDRKIEILTEFLEMLEEDLINARSQKTS